MEELRIEKENRIYKVSYGNRTFKSFASFCREFCLDDTQICDKMRNKHLSRQQVVYELLKKKGF